MVLILYVYVSVHVGYTSLEFRFAFIAVYKYIRKTLENLVILLTNCSVWPINGSAGGKGGKSRRGKSGARFDPLEVELEIFSGDQSCSVLCVRWIAIIRWPKNITCADIRGGGKGGKGGKTKYIKK